MIHKYFLNGYYIVIDTNSGAVHIVDELAYRLLDFFTEKLKGECPDEIISTLVNEGFDKRDIIDTYAELKALFDVQEPERTCVCILADKEEIGSDGVTGMQSAAFDCFMEDLCAAQGVELRRCYEKSFCISADVTNAYDPLYPDVSEKRSDAKINYGVGICKFTGARGKSGTSDASAEVVAYLRRLFAENNVIWQLAELGKVDQGGGGTIAKFMANRNIDTIDAGVPVLSMHAPFEVVAKLDCYMTYKACLAAYSDK